jgi:hypothetical protein
VKECKLWRAVSFLIMKERLISKEIKSKLLGDVLNFVAKGKS